MDGSLDTLFGLLKFSKLKVGHSLSEQGICPSWPDLNSVPKEPDSDVIPSKLLVDASVIIDQLEVEWELSEATRQVVKRTLPIVLIDLPDLGLLKPKSVVFEILKHF